MDLGKLDLGKSAARPHQGYSASSLRIDMTWNGALVVAMGVHNESVGMVLAEHKMSFPPQFWPNAQKAAFWLVLVSSIALNASFLGGYLLAGSEADQVQEQGGATSVVADRLGLDTGQRALFQDLRGEARAEAAVLRRANTPIVDAFWDELSKSHPNDESLRSFVEQVAVQNVEFTLRVATFMGRFLDALSLEQQGELIEMLRTRPLMRGRFLMSGPR